MRDKFAERCARVVLLDDNKEQDVTHYICWHCLPIRREFPSFRELNDAHNDYSSKETKVPRLADRFRY